MKTIRLYYPQSYQANTEVELSGDIFHHAVNVLRCKKADRLELFDGNGTQADAEVLVVERRSAKLRIHQLEVVDRESPLKTLLVQGISKGERMDFVLQKATELGVSAIQPLITERCNVQLDQSRWEKRMLHWQRVIISACEQSGRNRIPPLLPVLDFKTFLKKHLAFQTYLLHPKQQRRIRQLNIKPDKEVAFIVGSEGGFSNEEVTMSIDAGIETIGLGSRVLRTETAGLSVLAIAQALWGDI